MSPMVLYAVIVLFISIVGFSVMILATFNEEEPDLTDKGHVGVTKPD